MPNQNRPTFDPFSWALSPFSVHPEWNQARFRICHEQLAETGKFVTSMVRAIKRPFTALNAWMDNAHETRAIILFDHWAPASVRLTHRDGAAIDAHDPVARDLRTRPSSVFGRFVTGLGQSFATARRMHALASLDDRTLADIGIRRSDIPAIALHGILRYEIAGEADRGEAQSAPPPDELPPERLKAA